MPMCMRAREGKTGVEEGPVREAQQQRKRRDALESLGVTETAMPCARRRKTGN